MIEFEVPGEPYGKGRPRFTKTGRVYTPKKTVNYENSVKRACLFSASGEKLSGAVRATIRATCAVPKSDTKKNRLLKLIGKIFPTKKPDCDNIAKTILDALNKLAYDDDSQVVELHVYKRYGEEGKVEVLLEGLSDGTE